MNLGTGAMQRGLGGDLEPGGPGHCRVAVQLVFRAARSGMGCGERLCEIPLCFLAQGVWGREKSSSVFQ